MIKILIFSPFSLKQGRGGEISLIELAQGLSKFFKITLVDTNLLMNEKSLTKDQIKERLKNVHLRQIKFFNFKLGEKIFTLPYPGDIIKFFKLIKRNNVVYSSLFNIKFSLLLVLARLIHRKKKIIIGYRRPLYSHKLLSLYNLKLRIQFGIFKVFPRNFYHHTISKHAKDYLENFYQKNRIYHIIHGIDLDQFRNKKIKTDGNLDKHLKYIYTGYFDEIHKGFGVLLNGIELFLNENKNLPVKFEFCGNGPLKYKLIALEKKYPKNIRYHGYISNEKISRFYNKCDVLLFSSRREPFGRVLIEGLAAGLLILTSKTIGSIEILKSKEFSFFIKHLNSTQICTKIKEIYEFWKQNPNEFAQLKLSAQKYVKKRYSLKNEIRSFKRFIKRLIQKSEIKLTQKRLILLK